MADVFISYSRQDEVFVRRLHEGLTQQNRDIWIDWQDIPPTAEWLKETLLVSFWLTRDQQPRLVLGV